MVMENLFYKRNIARVYDLKGSERSRYNPDTTGTNKVMLDMNLLEALRTKPDIVIVDALIEKATSFRLIKALRSYAIFKNLIILAYADLRVKFEKNVKEKELELELNEIKKLCYYNGARYITSLDRITFLSILGSSSE